MALWTRKRSFAAEATVFPFAFVNDPGLVLHTTVASKVVINPTTYVDVPVLKDERTLSDLLHLRHEEELEIWLVPGIRYTVHFVQDRSTF